MASMRILPGDESKLSITKDAYGNVVGKELASLDLHAWIHNLKPRTVISSSAFCTSCGACVDGSWEGARAKCSACGFVGYYPDIRFSRKQV